MKTVLVAPQSQLLTHGQLWILHKAWLFWPHELFLIRRQEQNINWLDMTLVQIMDFCTKAVKNHSKHISNRQAVLGCQVCIFVCVLRRGGGLSIRCTCHTTPLSGGQNWWHWGEHCASCHDSVSGAALWDLCSEPCQRGFRGYRTPPTVLAASHKG